MLVMLLDITQAREKFNGTLKLWFEIRDSEEKNDLKVDTERALNFTRKSISIDNLLVSFWGEIYTV